MLFSDEPAMPIDLKVGLGKPFTWESDGELPFPDSAWSRGRNAYLPWKTTIEFCLAVVLLVLAAPVILAAMVLIKLTSRGPAFYTQTRLGRRGIPYTLWKLRTMYHDCEKQTGPCWSTAGDPRITLVGHFLRWAHVDELPQLWNVLRGEMNLIGPRPERPEFIPFLDRAVPYYRARLQVRPGITGLAQVQFPPDTDVSSVRRKLIHDLYYIRHCSPSLDLQVMLSTVCYFFRLPYRLTRAIILLPANEVIKNGYDSVISRNRPGSRPSAVSLKGPHAGGWSITKPALEAAACN
jgi:lipopolysaccharide/colanic/teichoic acid biosynthesis glycosyltransferase